MDAERLPCSVSACYCTLADTEALPAIVKVHVRVLLPPLEHAPDQTASRPFDTLSVTDVPAVNDAVPVLPTATLMPVGLERTRSPVLPLALTVNATVCPGGGAVDPVMVSVALLVTFW